MGGEEGEGGLPFSTSPGPSPRRPKSPEPGSPAPEAHHGALKMAGHLGEDWSLHFRVRSNSERRQREARSLSRLWGPGLPAHGGGQGGGGWGTAPLNKSRSQGSCQELLPGRDPGSAIRYVPLKGPVPVELPIPASCQGSVLWDELNELSGSLGASVSLSPANCGGRARPGRGVF